MLRPVRHLVQLGWLLLLAPALQAQQPAAPDSAKLVLIRGFLKTSQAAEQILMGIENALDAQKRASPDVPDVFWTEFVARAKASVPDLVEMLVPVYDREYSSDDLQGMIQFYQSPIGQKMLAAQPRITRDAMLAGQRWGGQLGAAVLKDLSDRGVLAQ